MPGRQMQLYLIGTLQPSWLLALLKHFSYVIWFDGQLLETSPSFGRISLTEQGGISNALLVLSKSRETREIFIPLLRYSAN